MIRSHPLPDDIEERLPLFADALARDERVDFAYLFGSLAKGRRGPLSDVDIAVYLMPGTDIPEATIDLMALANTVLRTDEVDLVVLNRAELMLRYRIIQGRTVLTERSPSRRAAFESRTLREGWDFLPYEARMVEGRGRHGD